MIICACNNYKTCNLCSKCNDFTMQLEPVLRYVLSTNNHIHTHISASCSVSFGHSYHPTVNCPLYTCMCRYMNSLFGSIWPTGVYSSTVRFKSLSGIHTVMWYLIVSACTIALPSYHWGRLASIHVPLSMLSRSHGMVTGLAHTGARIYAGCYDFPSCIFSMECLL